MFKNFIFHPRNWLMVLITTYAIVGSCKGKYTEKSKNRSRKLPARSASANSINNNPSKLNGATDSLHSEASNTSAASASSVASSDSPDSGYDSGYDSSSGSTSSKTSNVSLSTPFAALPNVGNTCYMNAVLQIIAALYAAEAQNRCLGWLINKINDTHHVLDSSDINKFIEGLPEAAKTMASSGRQHDPDEFIEHIKEHFLCLSDGYIIYPIICTEDLFLKIKGKKKSQEDIYRYNTKGSDSHMLAIPIVQGCNLSQIIKRYQQQLVEGEQGVDIGWKDISLCEKGSLPPFIAKNQNKIGPVEYDSNKGSTKDYIKQTILKPPDHLYIKLDRNPNQSKISDSVRQAMHIKIQSDPNQDATVSFDLNGFIVHRGDRTTGGHYVAYVKRKGKWYKADDSVITEISLKEATDKSKTAYLLFYTKN